MARRGECRYPVKDGVCGAPEFKRSYCEAHFNLCYMVSKTDESRRKGIERMADLTVIPYGPPTPGQRW